MKEQNINLSQLLKLIRSRREAEDLEEKIEKLERLLYHTKVSSSELKEIDAPESLLSIMPRASVSKDPEVLRSSLELLKTKLKGLSFVQIETGFEPDEETIDILAKWVRANLNEFLLLDLVAVPSLGGGLRISYQGRHWHRTLEDMLKQILEQKKDKILNFIRPQVAA